MNPNHKRKARGLCTRCSRRAVTKNHCQKHREWWNKWQRTKRAQFSPTTLMDATMRDLYGNS